LSTRSSIEAGEEGVKKSRKKQWLIGCINHTNQISEGAHNIPMIALFIDSQKLSRTWGILCLKTDKGFWNSIQMDNARWMVGAILKTIQQTGNSQIISVFAPSEECRTQGQVFLQNHNSRWPKTRTTKERKSSSYYGLKIDLEMVQRWGESFEGSILRTKHFPVSLLCYTMEIYIRHFVLPCLPCTFSWYFAFKTFSLEFFPAV